MHAMGRNPFQGLRFTSARFTVCRLQQHILPTEDLTGIFRYAMLLAGEPQAAQAAVLEVFADAAEKIHHFRNGKSSEAWLVTKVRNRLLNKSLQPASTAVPAGDHAPDALDFASRFSRLPEPGRSALALLYINRFSAEEIAQILQLRVEILAGAIDSARNSLRAMESARPAPASPAEGGPP